MQHASRLSPTGPVLLCSLRDIFVASYIYSLGFPMRLGERTLSEHGEIAGTEFIFEGIDQETVLAYFNDEIQFEIALPDGTHRSLTPKKLFAAFRELRGLSRQARMIHEQSESALL